MTRAEKLAIEHAATCFESGANCYLAGFKAAQELAAEIATQHGMCWDDSYGNACRAIERAIRQLDEEEAT